MEQISVVERIGSKWGEGMPVGFAVPMNCACKAIASTLDTLLLAPNRTSIYLPHSWDHMLGKMDFVGTEDRFVCL